MRSRKCAYLIEIGLKIEKKFSHDFMGLFHSMWEKTPLKSGCCAARECSALLSDSCPGIDENVEMGLREKKERFRSLKRFTQEKESIFPHCKKKVCFLKQTFKKSNKKRRESFFDNSITYKVDKERTIFLLNHLIGFCWLISFFIRSQNLFSQRGALSLF